MSGDLALDGGPRPRLEPREQDGPRRPAVWGGHPDDDLVLVGSADAFDRRAADPCPGGLDTEAMEVAPEPEDGTIAQAAASIELGALAGLPIEVPPEPRLALAEEGLDVRFRTGPTPAPAQRDGHDHTSVRVDDDPQAARSR